MKSRLSLGVLTAGLGAAALISFSAAPAMADHIDNRPAVVRADPPQPDPAKVAALLPKLKELSGKPEVEELTDKLEAIPAVADLIKTPPAPWEGDKVKAATADPKVSDILGKLVQLPAVAEAVPGQAEPMPGQPAGPAAPGTPGAPEGAAPGMPETPEGPAGATAPGATTPEAPAQDAAAPGATAPGASTPDAPAEGAAAPADGAAPVDASASH